MALQGKLHKVVWGGQMGGPDTWSMGVHFISPTLEVLDPNLMISAIAQWYGRQESRINKCSSLVWLKYNQVDPGTGKYVDASGSNTYFWPATVPQSPTTQFGDPAASIVLSTVTAAVRGRGSKGRMYPPTAYPPGQDGKIDQGAAQGMAGSAAQLITDLNGSNSGECYVWSQVGQVQHEIKAIRCGTVIDHQQRRRRQLPEAYYSVPIS